MIEILNRLLAEKCEMHLITVYGEWHVKISTSREGMRAEVSEAGKKGEDVHSVFFRVFDKFERITSASPELLPPRLEAPKAPEYTEFKEVRLDDDIPF